jgi:CheY-like chemotaxis protein
VPVNGSVLIVDADVNARIIAETLLRVRGLDVRSATDGPEACDIVQRDDISVVVLDLNLPGMNGFEVLRRLRSRFATPRLPSAPRVIVVTTRHEREVEHFALRLGADAFLRKPVEPREFIATVERLIGAPPRAVIAAGAH